MADLGTLAKTYLSSGDAWLIAEAAAMVAAFPLLASTESRAKACGGWLARLAARPGRAALVVTAVSFGLCVLMAVLHQQAPRFHDEFSYLLAADTFASGHLSNPPHALWKFFDTFHVLQQPTYMSKYPPGEGLVLAAGEALGSVNAATWVLMAASVAAVFYALCGMLPTVWALAGALAFALHGRMLLAWGLGYWGGALPMLGGALLYGGLARVAGALCPVCDTRTFPESKLRWWHGAVIAFGGAILGASRPYEGFLALVPAAFVLINLLVRNRATWRLLPSAAAVGVLFFAGMGAYNKAVTGDALTLPYSVHVNQYDAAPLFLWQPARTPLPAYESREMQRFQEHEAAMIKARQTPAASAAAFVYKIWYQFRFHLGLALLPFFVAGIWCRREPAVKLALAGIGLMILGNGVAAYEQPHYFAPVSVLIAFVCARGAQRAFAANFDRRWLLPVATLLAHPVIAAGWQLGRSDNGFDIQRAHLVERLEAEPGQHLVLVSYDADHDYHQEWVYNRARIDAAKVVFARDFGELRDQEILAYYKDRKVWRMNADHYPESLEPK